MAQVGKGPTTKSDEFLEKCQRGGGVIFNPKIYVADFGNFKQGFLIVKLVQNSNFRVHFILSGLFQGDLLQLCVDLSNNWDLKLNKKVKVAFLS